MPILSNFYGISIKMYFQQSEHNPPHIHKEEIVKIWNTQQFKKIPPLK